MKQTRFVPKYSSNCNAVVISILMGKFDKDVKEMAGNAPEHFQFLSAISNGDLDNPNQVVEFATQLMKQEVL